MFSIFWNSHIPLPAAISYSSSDLSSTSGISGIFLSSPCNLSALSILCCISFPASSIYPFSSNASPLCSVSLFRSATSATLLHIFLSFTSSAILSHTLHFWLLFNLPLDWLLGRLILVLWEAWGVVGGGREGKTGAHIKGRTEIEEVDTKWGWCSGVSCTHSTWSFAVRGGRS